jgi:hypothetical protein
MNTTTLNLFNSVRVNGIMQSLIQDPRLLPAPMVWRSRIPANPAPAEEIMARFIGTLLIADLIADDAKAGVYDQGNFQLETTKVPNYKIGIRMNQSMINVLARLQRYGGGDGMDQTMFQNWQTQSLLNALYGVEMRKEFVRVAMLMDDMDYDRLGIKMSGVSWGMYPDLKITVGTDWSNVNATPLTDIQTARRIARIRYGKNFTRMTLSTSALQYAVQTTQFINQAKTFGFGMFNGVPSPAIPLQSDGMLSTIFEKLISGGDATAGGGGKFEIEIDDRRYWTQDASGLTTNNAIQPITKVILTDSADDGNTNVWDFAQDVVTETILMGLSPVSMVGSLPLSYGPVGYCTLADMQANPPGLVHWGVDRGFARRKQLQCSSCLTVGSFTDTISTSLPFPV